MAQQDEHGIFGVEKGTKLILHLLFKTEGLISNSSNRLLQKGLAVDDIAQNLKREQGIKSLRNKNMKHFNKVGFAGDINKPIPRWAADENELNKININKLKNI